MHGDLWLLMQLVNSHTQKKETEGRERHGEGKGGGRKGEKRVRKKERKKGPDAGPDTLLQQVLKRGQSEKPCLS